MCTNTLSGLSSRENVRVTPFRWVQWVHQRMCAHTNRLYGLHTKDLCKNLCTKMTLHTNSLVYKLDSKFWEAPAPTPCRVLLNFQPAWNHFFNQQK